MYLHQIEKVDHHFAVSFLGPAALDCPPRALEIPLCDTNKKLTTTAGSFYLFCSQAIRIRFRGNPEIKKMLEIVKMKVSDLFSKITLSI